MGIEYGCVRIQDILEGLYSRFIGPGHFDNEGQTPARVHRYSLSVFVRYFQDFDGFWTSQVVQNFAFQQ